MTEEGENVPAYRTVRVAAPEAPVAAVADVEAWRSREVYPEILSAGGPVFGVVREREQGGWELVSPFSGLAPQDAREGMGCQFRKMAQEAEAAGDRAAREECLAAAERMDWEVIDEMTVLGSRFRVVRAERFLRSGPQGPEPPRITDLDPAPPGEAHKAPDPTSGFVIDPVTATGVSDGLLKLELLSMLPKRGSVPREVREDCLRAADTHPGGVLLPPTFMTVEKAAGEWRSDCTGTSTTPQGARDTLALEMRVLIPWKLGLEPAERAPYTAAADRLDADRGDELRVLGRLFRIVRVERLVRIGPDGPEGPRPSDWDPQPPIKLHDQQLREQGLLTDDDPDDEGAEDDDIELDAHTRKLAELFSEEEARRKARQEGR
ncbi:DUF5954 family protein [Streptomyces sp. NBRC 110028]|uniref:DUF5954 family protein n=1 Tax=Streptomyces sp. NBRC 110028 TaxID=1621260 RepID=UPI0006E24E23|nr:DUF5954 family protein [Streptomyces sp. NBRC 110028]